LGEASAPAWEYPLPAAAASMPMTALFGLKVRTIVVDAGHGGKDPGAVGVHGTREKDVALDIARRLASRLERDGRYRIVLTRSGDETVPLARRVEMASAADADLFVSIHVNALPNRNVNAIETYYFDFAKNPAALQLAAIENRDSEMPVGYFRTLLEEIGDTVKLQESKVLAQNIQESMISNFRAHDKNVFDSGVKAAPFVVLMGVSIPAILVEISCISNPDEEKKLRTPQYRETIASFLDEGISRYLDQRQLQARGPGHHERKNASEIADRHRQGS
jgi:N-acetylmuramoyl-L-alanine amidase